MIVKPKFYDDFKCIASACPDTCCAGWEIDVDSDTLDYYRMLSGEVGEFVRERLIDGDADCCAMLCREGETCRFLREDNLCELILRIGEDALCDICREHPRFYSGDENIIEVGVGLCCPEAARLWLESPIGFVFEDNGEAVSEDETETLARQMAVISHLMYGSGTLGERFAALLGDGTTDERLYRELRQLYASLEALDVHFGERFHDTPTKSADERVARLAAYFVYRYFFELGEELCVKFAAVSLIMIAAMGGELADAAKDYSKEVEYDPDNLERIYDMLDGCDSIGALCREVLVG